MRLFRKTTLGLWGQIVIKYFFSEINEPLPILSVSLTSNLKKDGKYFNVD